MNNKYGQNDLIQLKDELQFIWENTTEAVFVLNEQGSIIKANPFVEKLFGWSESELMKELIPPFISDKSLISQKNFIERIKKEITIKDAYRTRTKRNGEEVEILASYKLATFNNKNVIVVTYKDISDIKESEQRFKSLFMNNPDGIWSIDLQGYITSVNPALEKQLGYKEAELVGTHYSDLNVWNNESNLSKNEKHIVETFAGQTQEYELQLMKKNLTEVILKVKTIPITVRGKVVGLYGINKDITKQKSLEAELEKLAYTDSLTGLPNRRAVSSIIEEVLTKSKNVGLLFLDIDNFKRINDQLGHEAGDNLLIQFSKRISEIISPSEVFGRLSGDEFVIMIPELHSKLYAEKVAQTILHSLETPLRLNGEEIFVSTSIGIAYSPDHGKDKASILRSADSALYRAKEQGKNQVKYIA